MENVPVKDLIKIEKNLAPNLELLKLHFETRRKGNSENILAIEV
jgi:hypothetical protein